MQKKGEKIPTVRRRLVLAWGRRPCSAVSHVVTAVDAGVLGVSPGTRRVGDCGRAAVGDEVEQGVDALVRVDVLTALDQRFRRRRRRDLISPAVALTAATD